MRKLAVLLLAFAIPLLPACSAGPPETPPLEGAAIGGDFTLTDAAGQTVRWADFRGRWPIVYFGYTYCPDVCPTDVQRIMAAWRQLDESDPALAAQVVPVFISVDPARDDAAALRQFAAAFPGPLVTLTGTDAELKRTIKAFAGSYSKAEDTGDGGGGGDGAGYLVNHTSTATLFDPQGLPITTLPTEQGTDAIAAELRRWVR